MELLRLPFPFIPILLLVPCFLRLDAIGLFERLAQSAIVDPTNVILLSIYFDNTAKATLNPTASSRISGLAPRNI